MKAAVVPSATEHRLELRELPIPEPGAGQVRVTVEACGICHSDFLTMNNVWPGITYPRAPGHEIAGTIEALGPQTSGWKIGERVGIGWHGGHDGTCERCRRGDFITCRNLQIPGMAYDGGYAQYVVAPAVALARIPDELTSVEAAPLMCAGITTFNALRHSEARAGDLVAILGVGGLGHLAVQYAAKMGFRTIAIARGRDKEELARKLGAVDYIDSRESSVGAELQRLGGAKLVLSTVTAAAAMEPVLSGLGVDGQLLIVGASPEPLPVDTTAMIGKRNSIKAWPSGTCTDSEDAIQRADRRARNDRNDAARTRGRSLRADDERCCPLPHGRHSFRVSLELSGKLCRLRSYRSRDASALCAVADDFEVARWMTRRFPHPYALHDAEEWIATATADARGQILAIEVEGTIAGGVGVEPLGRERTGTALFGYWLGRAFWGRGIATEAGRMLSDFALQSGDLRRLEATVFAPNVASARVLEKCGFTLEGRSPELYLDRSGAVCDGLLFGRTRGT
jgi:alcohol dehydrogenase/propanol-preferring alcohol dehydrogenase